MLMEADVAVETLTTSMKVQIVMVLMALLMSCRRRNKNEACDCCDRTFCDAEKMAAMIFKALTATSMRLSKTAVTALAVLVVATLTQMVVIEKNISRTGPVTEHLPS